MTPAAMHEQDRRVTFEIACRNLVAYRQLMLPGLNQAQLAELQAHADALAGAIDNRLNELAGGAKVAQPRVGQGDEGVE